MALAVWLLGDAPGSGLDLLAAAIQPVSRAVDHLPDTAVHAWLDGLRASESAAVSALPNLLVVEAELAWADDADLLRTVANSQPWGFLPLVVVSRTEDDERCLESYTHGAAGWVVLPQDEARAREAAKVFARYWFHTTLLPLIDANARF